MHSQKKIIIIYNENYYLSCGFSELLKRVGISYAKVVNIEDICLVLDVRYQAILLPLTMELKKREMEELKKIMINKPEVSILFFCHGREHAQYDLINRNVSFISSVVPLGILEDVIFAMSNGYNIIDTRVKNSLCFDGGGIKLSARESTILNMIYNGESVGSMSIKLNIAERTIRTYKRRFLVKLGAKTMRDLLNPCQC
ncbi:helix-turn-helix domain-containing protein [Lelliottia amnigena]